MTMSSSNSEMMVKTVKKSKRYVKRQAKETKRPAESSDDEESDVKLRPQRRTKMVFGRANPIPPMTSSDEEDEVAISGDIHISSELPTTNISSRKKKSEEEAAFSEEVNISSAPDYALPSSGEEAAELASPLPDQSPLDPEAFCMKFFQVIKKQSCIIKFI